MSDLAARLRAIVEALPAGAAVTLPVDTLRAWLEGEISETGEIAGAAPEVGLTCEEVATRLGRSPSTVRSWCAAGLFPGAFRFRRREWRIPVKDLATLTVDTTPPPAVGVDQLRVPKGGLGAWRSMS